jgi:hypothetical protein
MATPTPRDRAAAFTRFAPVCGNLADEPRLVAALAAALEALRELGVRGALERFAR